MKKITEGNFQKKGFDILSFEKIKHSEQKLYMGGDWIDDWFDLIFDLSFIPTTNQPNNNNALALAEFKTSFREIISTTVGKKHFEDIKNSNHKIFLDGLNPIGGIGSADYDATDNHLRIGNFHTNAHRFNVNVVM